MTKNEVTFSNAKILPSTGSQSLSSVHSFKSFKHPTQDQLFEEENAEEEADLKEKESEQGQNSDQENEKVQDDGKVVMEDPNPQS